MSVGDDDNGAGNSFGDRLKVFLNDPKSSPSALAFYCFTCTAIVLSSLMMIVETLPKFYGRRHTEWFWLETSVVSALSIEFVLKLVANGRSIYALFKWVLSWSFLTEAVSVMPFWLYILRGQQTHADEIQRLTTLRLFRLPRLLGLFHSSDHLQSTLSVLRRSLLQSTDVLITLFLIQFLVATVFSTLLYFAERGTWTGKEWVIVRDGAKIRSKFDSIPACYWYVYTVLSTVGLGDMTPQSAAGKLLTWPLMMFTILLLTLPSVIIAYNFAATAYHRQPQ